jgi:hypothetical protein
MQREAGVKQNGDKRQKRAARSACDDPKAATAASISQRPEGHREWLAKQSGQWFVWVKG